MSMGKDIVAVTTTGSDGSATGQSNSKLIRGWIEDIFLEQHASAPGTDDITISYEDRGGNILVVTDLSADALYHPRAKPVDNANAAITNAHTNFFVDGLITVAVAQSDALTDAVKAYIRYSKP